MKITTSKLFLIILNLTISTYSNSQVTIGGIIPGAQNLAVGPSGNIYVTATNASGLVIIRPDESIQIVGYESNTDGNFGSPYQIAIDPLENVYVADRNYHRIVVFDKLGSFVKNIGTFGVTPGTLYYPRGVAIDPTNRIWVSNEQNDNVVVFNSDGTAAFTFGSAGSGNGQFINPYHIVFDQFGNAYVNDSGNNRIQKFDSNGNFVSSVNTGNLGDKGTLAIKDNELYVVTAQVLPYAIEVYNFSLSLLRTINPTTAVYGVAWSQNGDLLIADFYSLLRFTDFNGDLIKKYLAKGSEDGEFNNPVGVVFDSNNRIVVADGYNKRVQIFEQNGVFISKFGAQGTDDGQFSEIQDIAVDNTNNIYVLESSSGINRVQKFDQLGNFVSKISLPGTYRAFKIAIDASGSLYVAYLDGAKVEKYNNLGSLVLTFGSSGSAAGQFQYIKDIAIDNSTNNILVMDGSTCCNNRIQIFSSTGTYQSGFTTGGFSFTIGGSDIYSFNISTGKIDVFNLTGSLLKSVGNKGMGTGSFLIIGDMNYNASSNLLYTCDGSSLGTDSDNKIQIISNTAEIDVQLNSQSIPAGGTANLGGASVGGSKNNIFYIQSQGLIPLTLTGVPTVQLTGTNASDFTINASIGTTLSGMVAFQIIFTPSAEGLRTATITILNNDSNEGTYTITLQGYGKTGQTISFPLIPDKTYGDSPFTITANATSGLPVAFSSSNTSIASVSGNTITILDIGTISIVATQSGGDAYLEASTLQTFTITPKPLTIIGLTASKVYDGTTNLSLAGTPTLNGLISGDDVTLNVGSSSATFDNKSVGSSKVVTISGYTLSGADAGKYKAPTLTGDITQAPLTISGVTASNKVYDGATSATLSGTATLNGVITGDVVTLGGTATGQFADANAGNDKAVTVTGYTINGTDAANYSLSQPALSANITKANQTITFSTLAPKAQGDAAFTLGATSSSNLAVTYTIVSGPATVSGSTITLTGAGSVNVKASQAGDGNYNAATDVSQSFCVNPSKPAITVSVTNPEHPVLTSSSASGNQWYLNGTAISNATSATVNVSQAGNYTVKVTIDGCASATSDAKAMIVTGVESNDPSLGVVCYPNPAVNEITIHCNNSSEVQELKIIDLSGRVMQQGGRELVNVPVSVGNYGNGLYLVRIKAGNQMLTGKFLKN